MNLETYNDLVINWADNRQILSESTPTQQFIKLMEEYGELASGVSKQNEQVIKDSIGDCLVVLIILHKMKNLKGNAFKNLPKVHYEFKHNSVIYVAEELGRIGYIVNRPELDWDGRLEEHINEAIHALQDVAIKHKTTLVECLGLAWGEIKDRRGIMQDGVFIKTADLEKQLFELDKQIAEAVFYKRPHDELKLKADELQDLLVKATR